MTDSKPPRHPGGRPRIDPEDRSYSVHVSLPRKVYDELWRQSRDQRVSVPELFRRAIRPRLGEPGR